MTPDTIGVVLYLLVVPPLLVWILSNSHLVRGGLALAAVSTAIAAADVRWIGASPAIVTIALLLCLLLAATLIMAGMLFGILRKFEP